MTDIVKYDKYYYHIHCEDKYVGITQLDNPILPDTIYPRTWANLKIVNNFVYLNSIDSVRRQKGCGSFLLQFIIYFYRQNGYYSILGEIWKSNSYLFEWYENHGFDIDDDGQLVLVL